jgi:tight adherence protein B
MGFVALLTAISVFIFVWLLFQTVLGRKLTVAERVRELAGGHVAVPETSRNKHPGPLGRRATDQAQLRQKNANAKAGAHRVFALGRKGAKRAGQASFKANVDVWLRRADIALSARDYIVRWIAVVGTVTVLSLLTPLAYVGVLIVPVAFVVTGIYLRLRMQRRLHQFNEGLYDMLVLVSNALRAGHSFVQAMHLIVEESAGPLREEFERAEAEMQVGVLLEDALNRAAQRVGSEDFDLIVTAISIQRQIGGNLAEVLDRIASTIAERVKLKREIKALTSQGRLSAAIFMGLPAGVAVLLYVINPSYMSVLFQTSLGLMLVVVAVLGQVVGYFFIRRIVNVQL